MVDRPFENSIPGLEARVEPRIQVGWRGQLVTEDGRRFTVRVVDISASGAGLVGDDKLAHMQPVILEAQVPRLPAMDGHTLERWRATVAFQTFKGQALRSGLKFQDLSAADQELLRAWVGRHSKRRQSL
jgi:c-di-GMP-binding flagellar brake protein YcgR